MSEVISPMTRLVSPRNDEQFGDRSSSLDDNNDEYIQDFRLSVALPVLPGNNCAGVGFVQKQ